MTRLSDRDLDALDAAEKAATPGPWIPKHWNTVDGWGEFDYWDSPSGPIMRVIDKQYQTDRHFIALARNSLRPLLDELRLLRAVAEAAEEYHDYVEHAGDFRNGVTEPDRPSIDEGLVIYSRYRKPFVEALAALRKHREAGDGD